MNESAGNTALLPVAVIGRGVSSIPDPFLLGVD